MLTTANPFLNFIKRLTYHHNPELLGFPFRPAALDNLHLRSVEDAGSPVSRR